MSDNRAELFIGKFDEPVYRTTGKYSKFIGMRFEAVGFSNRYTLKIQSVYNGRNGCFRCICIACTDPDMVGKRRNYVCKAIVKNGKLVGSVKFLGA